MRKVRLPLPLAIQAACLSIRHVGATQTHDASPMQRRMRTCAPSAAALLSVLGCVAAAETAPAITSTPSMVDSPLEADAELPLAAPWSIDIDGDGLVDLANPTGHGVRAHDIYGSGAYAASRAGGKRRHRGVDYISEPGEIVRAPITGRVSHVGYAYRGDLRFLFVEVRDPREGRTARVLYVGPQVVEGQYVSAGDPIGLSQDLSVRYPNGITNHVHVEIADVDGAHVDASDLLPAGVEVHATTS
jgi:murein DD-endopeptidase MepM/ murein hydrolase activator NlpD